MPKHTSEKYGSSNPKLITVEFLTIPLEVAASAFLNTFYPIDLQDNCRRNLPVDCNNISRSQHKMDGKYLGDRLDKFLAELGTVSLTRSSGFLLGSRHVPCILVLELP